VTDRDPGYISVLVSGNEPAPFSVAVDETGDRVVVVVRGELDLATAPQLEDALLPPLNAGVSAVLDLRTLEFMDSTGVRVIVAAHLAAGEHGATLTVCAIPDGPVGRVLEISGLDDVLNVVADL
jgi:anti-sigma B factor antagonist